MKTNFASASAERLLLLAQAWVDAEVDQVTPDYLGMPDLDLDVATAKAQFIAELGCLDCLLP